MRVYTMFEHKDLALIADDDRSFFAVHDKESGRYVEHAQGSREALAIRKKLDGLQEEINKSLSNEKLYELLQKNYASKLYTFIKNYKPK